MAFFDFFKKKDPRYNHVLTDDDRNLAIEIKKANAEFKRKEQELQLETMKLQQQLKQTELESKILEVQSKLEEYDDVDIEPNGDKTDAMLIMLLSKVLNSNPQNIASVPTSNSPIPATEQKQHLTDEQLMQIYGTLPKTVKAMAKSQSPENLRMLIKNQLPLIDEDSLNRAVDIARA